MHAGRHLEAEHALTYYTSACLCICATFVSFNSKRVTCALPLQCMIDSPVAGTLHEPGARNFYSQGVYIDGLFCPSLHLRYNVVTAG